MMAKRAIKIYLFRPVEDHCYTNNEQIWPFASHTVIQRTTVGTSTLAVPGKFLEMRPTHAEKAPFNMA